MYFLKKKFNFFFLVENNSDLNLKKLYLEYWPCNVISSHKHSMKDTILHCIRVNEGTELAIKSGSDAQYIIVRLFFSY